MEADDEKFRRFKIYVANVKDSNKPEAGLIRDTGSYKTKVTPNASEFHTAAKRAAKTLFQKSKRNRVKFALIETTIGSKKDIRVYEAQRTSLPSPTSHDVTVYYNPAGKKISLKYAKKHKIRVTSATERVTSEHQTNVVAILDVPGVTAFFREVRMPYPGATSPQGPTQAKTRSQPRAKRTVVTRRTQKGGSASCCMVPTLDQAYSDAPLLSGNQPVATTAQTSAIAMSAEAAKIRADAEAAMRAEVLNAA